MLSGKPNQPKLFLDNQPDLKPKPKIFCTKDQKKVSFVMKELNGVPIDPKKYRFEKTTAQLGLVKSPYIEAKTNKDRGHKYDVWEGKKFWDLKPEDGAQISGFPVIFKYTPGI